MTLNVTRSRRWRLHETSSPRRRRRGRPRVHAVPRRRPCHTGHGPRPAVLEDPALRLELEERARVHDSARQAARGGRARSPGTDRQQQFRDAGALAASRYGAFTRCDSWPSHDGVGGFFFEEEAIRDASFPRRPRRCTSPSDRRAMKLGHELRCARRML